MEDRGLEAHDSEERLSKVIVRSDMPISRAIGVLDKAGLGVLLLCDNGRKLLGVVTDGNIRRALISNISTEQSIKDIATLDPVIGTPQCSSAEILELMDQSRKFKVNHLPIVDESRNVLDLILRDDLIPREKLGLSALIMAGGFGRRLHPLTENTPKPMLPVGDMPILERIIRQLKDSGISQVNISTHYLPDRIRDYFKDGSSHGVELNYVSEDKPLGTGGSLALIESKANEPVLVMNGDIVTTMDFRSMLEYHVEHSADLTVAVRHYDFKVPYGVLECEGSRVRGISEKPTYNFFVNAGIYLVQPELRKFIPAGRAFDMTDLVNLLIEEGRTVVSFPIIEYWLDIGKLDDFQKAQGDVTTDERFA